MHFEHRLKRLRRSVAVAAQQLDLPEAAQGPEMPGPQHERAIHAPWPTG